MLFVCVCVLPIYIISLNILGIFQEALIQIYDPDIYYLYKWVVFEKQRHCRPAVQGTFLISEKVNGKNYLLTFIKFWMGDTINISKEPLYLYW